MFAFKVLNNLIVCPEIRNLFEINFPSRTFRHVGLLRVEFHRTNYGKYSPLVRICGKVNAFSAELFANGLSTFKRDLGSMLF